MKNKDSQTKSRKIGLIVPITIYLLCLAISYGGSYIVACFYPLEVVGELHIMLQILNPIAMILSYAFSCLYIKKRELSCWGFALLIASPAILSYLKTEHLALALLSTTMILNNIVIGILLYMSYDWFRKARRQKELEKQNLQSELKLLKDQLSPHFLFNTLNNIDSLIHSNPAKASEALVQMSGMMRYMIYETNVSEVKLSDELAYIESYLHLQKLQYENPNLASYLVEGNTEGIMIAPMLFIPFIENTFKHCTNKKEKNAISFRFQVDKTEIKFEASNLSDTSKHINKDSSSGIGLNVVRRRLDFLYPEKHDLQIEQKNGYFCVSLKIILI